MKIALASIRALQLGATCAAVSALSGCYVVPMQSYPPATSTMVMPAGPPPPLTFSARLYPANDLATAYGMVAAVVTNDLNGRGHFSTAINGENFSGEATRMAGSPREGVANGAGNRGSYLNCRYTMNSPTLGTGSCRMSNGAAFTMHVGS
ncbi:MAG: hypothetical protein JWP41_3774 [Ramlibacter sp.]|jgi:hypothetical protein|nr:hypothetical protein [Ramlibacter sp.]